MKPTIPASANSGNRNTITMDRQPFIIVSLKFTCFEKVQLLKVWPQQISIAGYSQPLLHGIH